MGRLDGRVAIVSGAARGSGAETARLFAAEGARVAIADVLDDEGKPLAGELGDAALFVHLDVTSEEDWARAIEETERAFGRLDVLVNCAGVLRFGSLADLPLAEYMSVVSVNQVGTFLGMRAAVPALRRAGGGAIVNVSSIEGMFGGPGLVAYTASKFAVRGMTKVAAAELGIDGIRVNSVHPGPVDTPMLREAGLEGVDVDRLFRKRVPLGRAGRPADIARAILFLASDDAAYISGEELVVDGGATAFVSWFGSGEGR